MYRQFFIFRQMFVGLLFILAGILPASSFAQATICGSVFLDQNQNHTKDSGELLRANQVVYLIDWALVNQGQGGYFTTVTGENGQYCFLANTIGDYGVFTDIPADMTLTTPVEATGAMEPYSVKITSTSQRLVVDFGFFGVVSADEPIWGKCQDESKDDSVCVSNADYTMQVTPHKDATEVVPMAVSQASDGTYRGDNAAAEVVAGENDAGPRSARKTRDNSDEFAIVVGKNISPTGEEVALDATVNPDNSVSFVDPTLPTVEVTAHADGTYTGVDSETPTVSVAFDQAGNISATDSDDPTMSLVIDKATGKVTVTDSEYPTSMAVINSDGSRTITDEEFSHLIATVYANNEYVVQDIKNNMVLHIDSQGDYTIIDNENGVCVAIPGTRGLFGDIFGKAFGWIKDVFSSVTRFISKIAGFVAKVARFVVKVARVISVVARVVATIARVAAVLFPPLCQLFCAVAAFAEGVANISDTVGAFAERVATIAERIQAGGLGSFWVGNYAGCDGTRRGVREGTVFEPVGDTTTIFDIVSDIACQALDEPRLPLDKNLIRGYESTGYPADPYRPWTNIFGKVRGGGAFHGGWDLVAPIGTPVYSIADGEINYIRYNKAPCMGYGNCISISFKLNGNDYFAFYAHLSEVLVTEQTGNKPTPVTKGQLIGNTGITGAEFLSKLPYSEAEYHLHFEIRGRDETVPWPYKDEKKANGNLVNPFHAIDPKTIYGFIPKYELDWKKGTRSATRGSLRDDNTENCLKPPFLALDYLTASATANGNRLEWATIVEFDSSGFNVYRAEEKNAAGELVNSTKINTDPIPAQEGARWGAAYTFEDTTAVAGKTYYYMIEDVDSNGMNTLQKEFIAEVKPNPPPPAACLLYGVQDQALNDSIFFTYNPNTKTVQTIGEKCTGCDIEALDIHPFDDEIYLGSGDNAFSHPKGHLYKLDPNSGELHPVGNSGFKDISGLAFDDGGKLWAWAKGQGLVTLNPDTGQGELMLATPVALADLTWDTARQMLYGVIGKELWRYAPANGEVAKVCDDLPPKTEAIRVLPSNILPTGLVLLGAHRNQKLELQVFDITNCQLRPEFNTLIGYDDVEGLAIPMAACQ